jgi:hypothetical protein
MATKTLDGVAPHLSTGIRTTGVLNLSRALTQDEYDFLQTGIQSKLKRALRQRNQWFNFIVKTSERPEDLLNILSFVTYVGRTFIQLDSKGISTPEKVNSAIRGLEDLFLLGVFNPDPEPVHIAFGSATFRISDKEFSKVSYRKGQLEVRSGMLSPVWNPPVIVNREDDTSFSEVDKTLAIS